MAGRPSHERDRDANAHDKGKGRKSNRSGPTPVNTGGTAGHNGASGSGGYGGGSSEGGGGSKFDMVTRTLLAPFQHRKSGSTRILTDLAPVIMTPKMISKTANAQANRNSIASTSAQSYPTGPSSSLSAHAFATLGRAPLRLGLGSRRITSRDLEIVEAAGELLSAPIPDSPGVGGDGEADEFGVGGGGRNGSGTAGGGGGVSFLRGFEATIPSADKGRARRRGMRSVDAPRIGLKKLGAGARGLMIEHGDGESENGGEEEEDEQWGLVASGPVKGGERGKRGRRKRGRESLSANKVFGREELERQTMEIKRDKENVHVRRSLLQSEISEIIHKIEALDAIRQKLEDDLLKLQEDELELDDELQMVRERVELEEPNARSLSTSRIQSSRRRKGPAFLPSEHDELPPGVAFMTLECGTTPITGLDFSEPYGTLVTSTQDSSQPIVWDLLTGEEIGRLRGHTDTVKCIQVEDHICLTGSEDGNIRLWDLRRVDAEDEWEHGMVHLSDVIEEPEESTSDAGVVVNGGGTENGGSIRDGAEHKDEEASGACARILDGHSRAVSTLYFEDNTLVSGASDKTLRQWDLTTGQCVMTMDILWAISHPPPSIPAATASMSSSMFGAGGLASPGGLSFGGAAAAASGSFAVPTPPYADGSWDMYQDFVGAVQFWGYALVSGSGDGAVRMWDMRTGQAHRTLLGHTAPVTSLQFDEIHVVSGSLDKSIRIWDLRTGGIFETIKYDHAVTALQFDTRKIVAAAGENGVKVYNRTSMQHSTLLTNGHMRPIERLRYMDRYLVSGGRDSMVKIWAL